ncbi:MAG: hypothetical protein A2Y00_05855 [Omnitrophica WOR_2 bacterium GWF2_43_52]|nr:MAG: hypothetical protein A2Y00_05855 [Omnitrophica WOR_2 bacterium GWF2_43_52]OGX53213.1 MAG: hypothetical protein A2460_08615 [Omnitrophica WOR_2 bacterium RIFOXYC2_FULL_43_9]
MKRAYNIYCDESRIENRDAARMVIGALIIPRQKKNELASHIQQIFERHSFQRELKWVKTSDRFTGFYKAILDYFLSSIDMQYRCIIVDKSKLDYLTYHKDDTELAFFKFYYFMLRQKLFDFNRYYIILDKKPTRDKNRARALHSYLESYILLHRERCAIAHLQAYHSHENIFLQIVDYVTGLIAYSANGMGRDSVKAEIVRYLKDKLGRRSFLYSTPLSEEKFNIFFWKGKDAQKR